MQPDKICASLLRGAHHIHRVCCGINHGGPVIPITGPMSFSPVDVGACGVAPAFAPCAASAEYDLPDRLCVRAAIRVCVEGINRIVFRRHKQDIVHVAVAHLSGLVHTTAGRIRCRPPQPEQLAERVHVHVGRRQRSLVGVLSGMRQVVTPGRHRHRSWRLGGHASPRVCRRPSTRAMRARLVGSKTNGYWDSAYDTPQTREPGTSYPWASQR